MKIHLTMSVLAATASVLASLGSAVWVGSAKNKELDRLKVDVGEVMASDGEQNKTLSRLDERTQLILDTVKRIEDRR